MFIRVACCYPKPTDSEASYTSPQHRWLAICRAGKSAVIPIGTASCQSNPNCRRAILLILPSRDTAEYFFQPAAPLRKTKLFRCTFWSATREEPLKLRASCRLSWRCTLSACYIFYESQGGRTDSAFTSTFSRRWITRFQSCSCCISLCRRGKGSFETLSRGQECS